MLFAIFNFLFLFAHLIGRPANNFSRNDANKNARSQEVKLLIDGRDIHLALFTSILFSLVFNLRFVFTLFVNRGESNPRVEFRDFMCILAGAGYLDRSSPVVVKVTKSECQMFEINFANSRLVHSDIEMCW